jgi:hypothetical protein
MMAEYVALGEVANNIMEYRFLLADLDFEQRGPTYCKKRRVYCRRIERKIILIKNWWNKKGQEMDRAHQKSGNL